MFGDITFPTFLRSARHPSRTRRDRRRRSDDGGTAFGADAAGIADEVVAANCAMASSGALLAVPLPSEQNHHRNEYSRRNDAGNPERELHPRGKMAREVTKHQNKADDRQPDE